MTGPLTIGGFMKYLSILLLLTTALFAQDGQPEEKTEKKPDEKPKEDTEAKPEEKPVEKPAEKPETKTSETARVTRVVAERLRLRREEFIRSDQGDDHLNLSS